MLRSYLYLLASALTFIIGFSSIYILTKNTDLTPWQQNFSNQLGWASFTYKHPIIWSCAGFIFFFLFLLKITFPFRNASANKYLASSLFVLNPVFLLCFTIPAFAIWPSFILLMCSASNKVGTKLNISNIAALGLAIPALTYHSWEGLILSFTILIMSPLLLPFHIIARHGLKSAFTIAAPSLLIFIGISYLILIGIISVDLSNFFDSPIHNINSLWVVRHQNSFLTAFVEFSIWSCLITPFFISLFLEKNKPSRLIIFSTLTPAIGSAIATDFGVSLAPFSFIIFPITMQFVVLHTLQSKYLLVSSVISWLGSMLIVWYYLL